MRNWNLCLDSWSSEDLSSILWWYTIVAAIMLRLNTWIPSRIPKPQSMNNKTAPILPSWFKRNAQVFGLTVLLSDSCCDCQLWKLWKYVSNWTSYYLPYAILAVDCWYTHDYCLPWLLDYVANASTGRPYDLLFRLQTNSTCFPFLVFPL